MWNGAVGLFRDYMGTGLIIILYVGALIFLWIQEKRKHVRILFLYMPLILLALFFNPLFAGIAYRVEGDEIYYRILWLLPITLTIACAVVTAYGRLSGKRREVFAVCAAGLIAVSGSCIYANPFFRKAENVYHVPDSVVHICDTINIPGREVRAVFPAELLQYVRQYSPVTCMPYGREVLVPAWGPSDLLYDVMEAETVELELLVPLAREAKCHYLILRGDKEMRGTPEEYGLVWLGETDGYVIYRDPQTELSIPRLPGEGED